MSRREEYEAKTEKLILPILEQNQCELVDIEFVKEAGTWFLRIYADKEGGITIDDCESISRTFSDILDREDYIEETYIFEVSSPGLGRPLKKPKDFERNLNKEVELHFYQAIDHVRELEGLLIAYDDKTVTVAPFNAEGEADPDNTKVYNRKDISLIRQAILF